MIKYLFLKWFCKYSWVFVDTCGYEKNRRIPDGYEYRYRTIIYPAGRVRGSYYLYPTRPVDIPSSNEPPNMRNMKLHHETH